MTPPRVAYVHYSCPPVIGGVEVVLKAQAEQTAAAGMDCKVVVGVGEQFAPGITVATIPELSATHDRTRSAHEAALAGDRDAFDDAADDIAGKLADAVSDRDVVVVHNMLTMHFNLAATAALAGLAAEAAASGSQRFISVAHDATFNDPSYAEHQRPEYPWSLLSGPLPGVRYATISEARREEIGGLFGYTEDTRMPVLPNGVDAVEMLALSPMVEALFTAERLYERDAVCLTPARIVRRKNFEEGFRVVAAMKAAGADVFWMITGAPDPHNPATIEYYRELLVLRSELGLDDEVAFLSAPEEIERLRSRWEDGGVSVTLGLHLKPSVSDEDLRGLFAVSDVMIMTSRQEGFGIPVLEAGVFEMTQVLSDIGPLEAVAGDRALYVSASGDYDPDAVGKAAVEELLRNRKRQFRKQVMRDYSWQSIFETRLRPLLMGEGG